MKKNLFDYNDYRKYLSEILPSTGEGRGSRSRLAKFLGCQTAFVSQVLNGSVDFSLEHAARIGPFLNHSPEEFHFFMLLLQKARAGSVLLSDYYQKQIEEIQSKRQVIQNRVKSDQSLSQDEQSTYYSSWYYAAIHVLLSIPEFQSPRSIAEKLSLPIAVVSEALSFLVDSGLAQKAGENFKISDKRVHLGLDKVFLKHHHLNWRIQAMSEISKSRTKNLHYSLVFTVSKKDAEKIRERMLAMIEEMEKIFVPSKEEALYATGLDFYEI